LHQTLKFWIDGIQIRLEEMSKRIHSKISLQKGIDNTFCPILCHISESIM